ncbi:MAG: TonB-dependent receptor [Deltaproteobacteria bacterium]|nr:TonB-dependent receptor [Deltaproteobacteria bacterium]
MGALKIFAAVAAVVLIQAAVPARAQDATGVLSCYVFLRGEGKPMSGVLVSAGSVAGTTNADGAVRLTLPDGTYSLSLSAPDMPVLQVHEVRVVGGEVTEAVVTVDADGNPPVADVEVAPIGADVVGRTAETTARTGRLTGRVVNGETGEPVSGARLFVKGTGTEAVTGAGGEFSMELPEGIHTISVIQTGFSTRTIGEAHVTAGAEETLSVDLTPSGVSMEDYTVTAPHVEGGVASMLDERRKTAAVSDVIGAEQISKSGDSSAASALKRVTGLTVVGGKYVYVRGMGERYSSTLLNGSTLPSPEPERRVVPLDMFPADLLEGVVVQKTYLPDMPGEFGGGAVMLRTRGIPEEFLAEVSVSGGYHTGTTGEGGLMYEGGDNDWLGMDDGSRELPGSIRRATEDEPLLERDRFSTRGYTAEELEEFGEDMPNVWKLERKEIPMDRGLAATVGHRLTPFGIPIGFLGGLTYDNSWELVKAERNYYTVGAGKELELQHSYDFETLNNEIGLGGIFNFGVEPTEDHRLQATTILIRTTDNETRVYEGENRDAATDIKVTRLSWLERQLLTQQFSGEHVFPILWDIGIDWRYTYSEATRDEPDRREVRYDLEQQTGRYRLSDRPEGNQRLFSNLEDVINDFGADLTIPFKDWRGLEANVKAGGVMVGRKREVDTRRFKYQHKGEISGDPEILSQPPEDIFVPENIGSDGFQFEEITRQTDNYKAEQEISAFYGMADVPIVESVRVVGGVRAETSRQVVETFELFNPDFEPIEAKLETTDNLPGATATWTFWRDMQVRGAYSKTVSRPEFRELSPATFNDVTGGRQIFGNPDLKRALIDNYDLRWEFYPSETESVSLAFFYKRFKDPIETIVVPSAQLSITYQNADQADNYGLELDFRKNFDFFGGGWRDLYLSGNLSWIESDVDLGDDTGVHTEDERPLQGQSPYVINLMLGYDSEDLGVNAAALYNVFGERIVEVGAQGAPDVVEQPFHQVDIVAGKTLPYGFKVSAKAKNLLDLEARTTQDDEITERDFKGREFSLGLSWRY